MPYADREKQLDYWRRYGKDVRRGKYRERQLQHQREYVAKNREHISKMQRAWYIAKKYGVLPEEVAQRLAEQGGRCGVCQTTEPKGRFNQWNLDHDHETGQLRGVLCWKCNVALGHYEKRRSGIDAYLARFGLRH